MLLGLAGLISSACDHESSSNQAPSPAQSKEEFQTEFRVIYGDHDRKEYGELTSSKERQWADAVVALVKDENISCSGDTCTLSAPTTLTGARRLPLCDDVPEKGQPAQVAFCTGFLIEQDGIVTAGHCLKSGPGIDPCEGFKVVFGFHVDQTGQPQMTIPRDQVYSNDRLVKRELDGLSLHHRDWAIIGLDRLVPD